VGEILLIYKPTMNIKDLDKAKQQFIDEYFFPCEVVDGDFCFKCKEPIYVEDTGGKRLVGYKEYPDNKCACGAKQREQKCWKFIENLLSQSNQEIVKKIEGLKKKKTADRVLNTWDGKTEHIKYFENDSDPAYNRALEDVIQKLTQLRQSNNLLGEKK